MYPNQLSLSPEKEAELKEYLHFELINHYMEREQYVDKLIKWAKEYWSEPASKLATFPFQGAANIIVPLTAIAVETIHARTMTTLFSLDDQFVSVKAKNKDWTDFAVPVERFLNHEMLNVMDVYKPFSNTILEIIKFGTGIIKDYYERVVKYAGQTHNGIERIVPVVIKDGAQLCSTPIGKFLMPFDNKDVQGAAWVGEEHTDTIYQIELGEKSGLFKQGTTEALWGWVTRSVAGTVGVERRTQRTQELLEDRVPVWPKWIDWVEIWLSYDIDGSGVQREIVVYYHRAAQYFMAIRDNWNADVHRPYEIGTYFPVEHRWTGIGICQQNSDFQNEITAQHRQRLDNATMANMRMLKINKSAGYGPGEPLFPGKMFLVDNKDDIEPLEMAEIYASAFENEQATLIYSQQRTGVNEVTLGQPQVGTPGTATGDLARLQEGNKKWDYFYKNVKRLVQTSINRTALNIQAFGPRDLSYYEQSDGGKLAEHFFRLPPSWITDGLILQMAATGQQQNKIIDRQNWVQVAAMITQYIQGMLQLAEMLGNQQLAQTIATKGLAAGTEAIRQILETYDIRNIDKFLVLDLEQTAGSLANQVLNGPGGPSPINSRFNLPPTNGSSSPDGRISGGNGEFGSTNGSPGFPGLASLASALGGGSTGAPWQFQRPATST